MNTVMTWQTNSTASEDTEKLGELLGRLIDDQLTIELRSDLGGGKTTFVRGLARGLSSGDTVSSPTFTLNRIYKCRNGLEIRHFDFYRLKEAGIISNQLAESLNDKRVITVVEWSDIVKDVLPKDRLTIEIKTDPSNTDARHLRFVYSPSKSGLIKKLQTDREEVRP